ncbi:phosphoinositide-3-kinase-interacting protein 1 isoform X3 [Pipistrellus kuhlii]|uniref:phosphoinositide-3-kinase-interacting protein 1 isoform X3 n=1 Tax=Pipistrellus kuhlii TaxID=59472 RepID=UPI001E2723AD|nr:phosphoinositide-3-kinase-interacting protein 1 isoform X3 [Pipistrellus kuhlii]
MPLEAAGRTTAAGTGRTSRPRRRASAASTGWRRTAAWPRPPRRAPATTATAATRTGTRAGPGATSAARPAPPRSGAARTRAAQVLFSTSPPDLPTSVTETEEAFEVPSGEAVQLFAPANSLSVRSQAATVQPVVGMVQRVQGNSKEKKDLGILGNVLGMGMIVIIIAIGVGIIFGYTYKRAKRLKEQYDQKVHEREMQPITLPLSAFTNATCDLVDETTVVVHPSQTPVDLQEGDAPLMGQAGTPGA